MLAPSAGPRAGSMVTATRVATAAAAARGSRPAGRRAAAATPRGRCRSIRGRTAASSAEGGAGVVSTVTVTWQTWGRSPARPASRARTPPSRRPARGRRSHVEVGATASTPVSAPVRRSQITAQRPGLVVDGVEQRGAGQRAGQGPLGPRGAPGPAVGRPAACGPRAGTPGAGGPARATGSPRQRSTPRRRPARQHGGDHQQPGGGEHARRPAPAPRPRSRPRCARPSIPATPKPRRSRQPP